MLLRQHPRLEGKSRGIRSYRQKSLIFRYHAHVLIGFLPDNIAKHAAFLEPVIVLSSLKFFQHMLGHDGQRNQLPVGMFQRCSCGCAMVLEDHDVLEALVFLQIEDAVAEGPQHILNPLFGQRCQRLVMVRRLNNDFVRADAVHLVEHAIGRAVQAAFNLQCRKLVGHYTNRPTLGIAPGAVRTVSKHFGRCLAFVAGTKRAKSALQLHRLPYKIGWALRAVSRDDYPSAYDGIFTKFRHCRLVSCERIGYLTPKPANRKSRLSYNDGRPRHSCRLSGKAMARTGLRMMPTFPSPPLKVGSRSGAVSLRFRLPGAPRFLLDWTHYPNRKPVSR